LAASVPEIASLLPPNATAPERALEQAMARLAAVPVPLRQLWNPQTCPVSLLPWLAWALRVREWDSNWPEATQRAVIAASVPVHKRKGTLGSIKQALAAAGYPDAVVIERVAAFTLDGSRRLDGEDYLGDPSKWAWYRVVLAHPVANSQAAQVRRILADTAPARCRLEGIDFTQAAFILDGTVRLDGGYNMGVVA
jgi:phage tail P2-like protein